MKNSRFTRKIQVERKVIEVTIPCSVVEQVIKEIFEDDMLRSCLDDYFIGTRVASQKLEEPEELKLRGIIFPKIRAILKEQGELYEIFSSEIFNLSFQKIEDERSN